jgi:hypothetical protein
MPLLHKAVQLELADEGVSEDRRRGGLVGWLVKADQD